MGLIQSSRPPGGGGGGGGLVITDWATDTYEQSANFISGEVIITLTNTPISPNSIVLDYNGQVKYLGVGFSISGNEITILFEDPYVDDYEDPAYFHITYPY